MGNRWIALHRDPLIRSSVQLCSWDFPGPFRNSPEGLQGECTVHFRFETKLSETEAKKKETEKWHALVYTYINTHVYMCAFLNIKVECTYSIYICVM